MVKWTDGIVGVGLLFAATGLHTIDSSYNPEIERKQELLEQEIPSAEKIEITSEIADAERWQMIIDGLGNMAIFGGAIVLAANPIKEYRKTNQPTDINAEAK